MFGWGGLKILGLTLRLEGREILRNMQPSVMIANHQNNLDLFVFGSIVPKRTVTIGKKSLRYLPIFGQVYWLAGNILIDRKKSRQSINAMSETAEALRHKQTSIWVFPEGTRNYGKDLLPFKKGAFHIAKQAQAPIIPICASSYGRHVDLNKWRAGTILVRVLAPVEGRLTDDKSITELRDELHQVMKETVAALDAEVMADV